MLSEFTDRPWQTNVICEAKDGVLRLSAVNDFDSNGQALVDEFQDAVVANVRFHDRVSFGVESVSVLSRPADDQADSGEEPTFSKHSVVNNN